MQIQNALLTGSTTVYGPITFVSGSIIGSASYAQTSSYADTFTVAGSLTAQTLVVQTITSSISYITGSTRFGSLLTNTHTFTGSLQVTGSAINLSNSKIIIGDDGTYGGNISTVGFGGTTNGFNRIAAANNTTDGIYLIAATGRGIYFRPGGKSTQDLSVFPNGNTALGVNFLLPTATLHISGSGSGSLMQISSTVSSSIFFVSGSGNVGINTITPTKKLDVFGDIRLRVDATGLGPSLILNNGTEAANNYSQIAFGGTVNAATYLKGAIAYVTLASTNGRGDFYFLQNPFPNGNNADLSNAVVVINNTGSMGIGITSPAAVLHVSGSGSGSLMRISSTVSSSIFFVSGSGNIGIGTTTPSAKVHAVNSGNGFIYRFAGGTSSEIAGGIFASTAAGFASIGTTSNHPFNIFTNDTDKLTVTSAGNVGIGITSPSSILHISASSNTITGKVLLQSPSSDSGILQIGSSYGEASMMFIPGVTAFGTSSPTRTSSFGNAALWGLGPGTYTSDHTKFGIANVGYGTNVLTVSASGALGIGTTSPTSRLFVLGAGSYNTPTTEILTSDATIFSSEMSNDAYNSILQLVSVRQSLSTGASSNGFLGFSTIDDSNGEGIRDAGRIAIVNESAASRNSATALSFWTNPGGTKTTSAAEKLRLTSGGYLRLASSGIQFQGATAAANALNYYEQGSWTPALQNATVSYSERSGTYVRIGDYVFVRWGFRISTISGQSGTVTISGLPFTAVSWGSYQEPNISVSTGVLATADNAFKARVYKGGGDTSMYGRIANNADTTWDTSQLQNGSWIIGEIFYNVP